MRTFRITASSATAVALATTTIFVPTAIAQTAPAAGGVEIIDSADGEVDDVLTGYVFEDTNGNST
ncbi:hypothetical protein [Corynebacterium yudongzhengii]|uniref:hypothetical protein n=1 Tax=Corynebacterium yudongzhengii TaxID=2080740 RepID=UPI0018EE9414|nr:hypothetical protein [Corynebacterium yudongzhengii]